MEDDQLLVNNRWMELSITMAGSLKPREFKFLNPNKNFITYNQYGGVVFPTVSRVFSQLVSSEFVPVAPMEPPSMVLNPYSFYHRSQP